MSRTIFHCPKDVRAIEVRLQCVYNKESVNKWRDPDQTAYDQSLLQCQQWYTIVMLKVELYSV